MNHKGSSVILILLLLTVAPPPAAAQMEALQGQWVAAKGEVYGEAIPEASLPLLRVTFDGTEAQWTIPAYPQIFRYTAYGEGAPDSLDFHLPIAEPREWLIPVRSRLSGDTLSVAFPVSEPPYDPDQGTPPARPSELALSHSGELVPGLLRLSLVRPPATPPSAPALSAKETQAADAMDVDAIEQRTHALVAPEMEGRSAGHPGGVRAAHMIVDWFREAGLEPLGTDGFLQTIPFLAGRAMPSSSLTVGDTTFYVGTDFSIASLLIRTRPAMRLDTAGELVLFGQSLGAARSDEPLPKLDVEGKVVAWLVEAPAADGSKSDLMRTYEALHRSGAAAIIAVFSGPFPESLLRSPLFSGITTLADDLYGPRPARPLVLLGAPAFGALFGDGADLVAFMGTLASGEDIVQPTGKHVAFSYEIEETTAAPTYNVAGVIRGTDPDLRDEAVVYTAHYDALGPHEGSLYPGAADNALGVAEMVEIAEAIRDSGVQPRRSIVFLAVGAEERGMLGTLHWMRQPTWPLDRVVANINMDGGDAEAWGPLHAVIDVTRYTTLGDMAAELSAAMGVPLLPNDAPDFGSSDFYDFLRSGIPAIQLVGLGGDPALALTRLQRYSSQRIHQPGDVPDEEWDWSGPHQMAQLYLLLGLRVANADDRPRMRGTSR
ncbi:MAG: M20/M25/M40 family metallo-hydrolase [Gemmatimonadota bacterium]|nr:M20/M25/M40 family metallo-hydrolase [Gemmatimonadota bacterium]MDH5760810.1 M20/M25/M40 family metallo-hydrolase [Gemmatimonadota bacterium]